MTIRMTKVFFFFLMVTLLNISENAMKLDHTHIAVLQAAEPPPPAATPSVLRLQPLCLLPLAKQDKEDNCYLVFYT